MNRELVESFMTIVRLQSVSAAANYLYVSQSTISHRLQTLEAELKTKLFYRQRGFKQITLTQSGKNFIPLASQWLELDDNIHQTLSNSSLGTISVGSMDSLTQYLLGDILRKIKTDTPKLNLEFVSYHSQEIYSRLTSGQLDIAFAFYPVHYKIDATPVFREPMYMICPTDSIYPEGPVHPSQLKKCEQIFFQWNPQIRAWNDEWWTVNEPPYVKVDSTALLSTFLTEPFHWAICPATVANALHRKGTVEIHPFEVPAPDRICYLLCNNSIRGYSEALEIFIDSFYKLQEKHPWKYYE